MAKNDKTFSLRSFGQLFPPDNGGVPLSRAEAMRRQQAAEDSSWSLSGILKNNILPAAATAALVAGYVAFAPVVTTVGVVAFGLAGFAGGKTYSVLKSASKKEGILAAFARAAGGTCARRMVSALTVGALTLGAAGLAGVRLDDRFKDTGPEKDALTDTVKGGLASGKLTMGGTVQLFVGPTGMPTECDNLRVNKIPGNNVDFSCTAQYQDGMKIKIRSEPFKASELSVDSSGNKTIVTPNDRDSFLKRAFPNPRNAAAVALGKEIRDSAPVSPSLWFHNLYTTTKTKVKQVLTVLGLSSKAKPLTPG